MITKAAAARIEAYGATDIGRKRPRNEDHFVVATLNRSLQVTMTSLPKGVLTTPTSTQQAAESTAVGAEAERGSLVVPQSDDNGVLLMVADGMGGHRGGAEASAIAVETITQYVCNVMPWFVRHWPAASTNSAERADLPSLPGVREGLANALMEGQSRIQAVARSPGRDPRMGTTLTLGFIMAPHLYIVHVGDSRCYLLRDGKLRQVTKDHTLAQQFTDAGLDRQLDEAWHHVLWNALGGGDGSLKPELHHELVQEKDVIMLCSDGLTKHLDDAQIAEVLGKSEHPSSACHALVDKANAAGGADNITVVCAFVH